LPWPQINDLEVLFLLRNLTRIQILSCLRRWGQALRAWLPGLRRRERQDGRGLASPARGHLNPSLDGWGFRGRALKIAPRNAGGPRSAARHDREANARYDPARLRSKSPPVLPRARLLDGKNCVSRPIEGLDSHGAVRKLRMT